MADSLAHRGPDDDGTWFDAAAGVGFAHRRLAVLDLSPAGHQPMAYAGGRLRITYNGELYNFPALRAELAARGHVFGSCSDTEVVLAAVAEWGIEGALGRFNGMFAFALWDAAAGRLYLARDRVGEKPLYYGRVGGAFAFASELGALRRLPGFAAPVDRGALALLLRYGYIPAPYSIYEGIAKLPPGAWLAVSPGDAATAPPPRRYWDAARMAEAGAAAPLSIDAGEAVELLEKTLERAVERQLLADVPVGAFLSGGIDSSMVVALMQKVSPRPVRTFTIGFREGAFDEAPAARRVAEHLGTDHRELYVSPQDALEVIPRLASIFDEPFADPSQIPTFLVAGLARQEVTVCLSGDGGDELFSGYPRYRLGRDLWARAGWLPAGLRRHAGRLLAALPPSAVDRLLGWAGPVGEGYGRSGAVGDKLQRLAAVIGAASADDLYRELVSHWRNPQEVVLGAVEPPTVFGGELRPLPALASFEHRMMYRDLVSYLPDDILVKVDRAAMAVSLETRLPILDPEVIELAWRLPGELTRRRGQGKWLLRQVLHRHLPAALVERPKRGFAVPVGEWLRGPLRGWAEELLAPGRLSREGFFAPTEIRRRWREHLCGERDWRYELWSVLVFQQWWEESQAAAVSPARVADLVVG